jgi:hypothetical protein
MFVTDACSEWFWIIPLIGMVFMIGMMMFMCRMGLRNGFVDKCGCGGSKEHCNQEHIEAGDKPPTEKG